MSTDKKAKIVFFHPQQQEVGDDDTGYDVEWWRCKVSQKVVREDVLWRWRPRRGCWPPAQASHTTRPPPPPPSPPPGVNLLPHISSRSPCYGALWQFVSWLEMPELCASDPSGRTSCAPVADGWAYCAVQQAGRSCLSCKEESCSCTTLTTSAPNQDPAPENFWQTAPGNLVKILGCDEAAGWVKRVAWSTLDSSSSTMLLMPKTRY